MYYDFNVPPIEENCCPRNNKRQPRIYVGKNIKVIRELPPIDDELSSWCFPYEIVGMNNYYDSICVANSMFSPLFHRNEMIMYSWLSNSNDNNDSFARHFGEVWIKLSGSFSQDCILANNEIAALQQNHSLIVCDEFNRDYSEPNNKFSDVWRDKAPHGYTWHYVFMGFRITSTNLSHDYINNNHSGCFVTNISLPDDSEITVKSAVNWKQRWNPNEHKALMQLVRNDVHKSTLPHFSSTWQYECINEEKYVQDFDYDENEEENDNGNNSENGEVIVPQSE